MYDYLAQWWSQLASFMLVWSMLWRILPFRDHVHRYTLKLTGILNPYAVITFDEYPEDQFSRSPAYDAIKLYLGDISSLLARRLRVASAFNRRSLLFRLDDGEEITDTFRGVSLLWSFRRTRPSRDEEEKRRFVLRYHRRHRKTVLDAYLSHIFDVSETIASRRRQKKIYTNRGGRKSWSYDVFNRTATFQNLAMEQKKKDLIIEDLDAFSAGKEYYARTGKPWKRGYLLYGPPGTGKSSLIAAMANHLSYDVYQLMLSSVKDDAELMSFISETTAKSIIAVEDIDCALGAMAAPRGGKKKKKEEESEKKGGNDDGETNKKRGLTLSGLLNIIDGVWSKNQGERIIVFTTNHVEKLDPALIRTGRMDMHIEMSYCRFEGFKVLAKNFLEMDEHQLFVEIRQLLGKTKISAADVAEKLMRKSPREDADAILMRFIQALKNAKEKAEGDALGSDALAFAKPGRRFFRLMKR